MVSLIVEDGLEIVGDNHKFQMVMTIILFLIGVISDVPFHAMPIMETNPIVTYEYNGQIYNSVINYTICEKYNYTVNYTLSKSTWVLDYNIYCDKMYVSSIGFFTLFGGLLGTVVLHFIKNKERKWPFIFMGLLISLSTLLLISNNFFLLITYNILCALGGIMIYVWRINTISEITNKSYRSYYNNIQMTSSNFCIILIFTLFNHDVNWRVFFFCNGVLLTILIFFFHRYYIENPRFYYIKEDKDKMMSSLVRIARFNGLDTDPLFQDKINTFMRHLKFGDSSRYEQAVNSPQKDNVIKLEQEISVVNVYTTESLRINTNLNTEEKKEEPKMTGWRHYENFIYVNFIISAPLCSFLAFMYNYEIKNFSYDINEKIYLFCLLSVVLLFFIAPIMNVCGRKLSKLLTIIIFFVILIMLKACRGIFSESFMYLINRTFIHLTNHINLTHLNESFPTNKRLHVFNITHLISKFLLLSAPLIYEYLETYRFYIEIVIIIILITCFIFQKETANKKLQDK